MAMLLITLGVVTGLAIVGFAVVGVWCCLTTLISGSDSRALMAQEARQAEVHIAEVGRRAQEAIMAEALRRFATRDRER